MIQILRAIVSDCSSKITETKKNYRQVNSTEKKNEPQLCRTFPASLFLRVLSGYEANGIDIALALNSRNTFPMTVLDLA